MQKPLQQQGKEDVQFARLEIKKLNNNCYDNVFYKTQTLNHNKRDWIY